MKTETALLIFDPHQDADWIRRILKQEEGNFSHLLLGGDYFDAKSDRAGSLAEMASLLLELEQLFGKDMTLLWGNHDIQYLEAIPFLRRYKNPRIQKYNIRGDYSNSKAKKLSKLLAQEFLEKGKLYALMNGYLISHAGLANSHWRISNSFKANMRGLAERARSALLNINSENSPLLQAGRARGGSQLIGGITWLDFDEEFLDNLPMPQIFGHTPSLDENISSRARQYGRSWNLDGAQTIYGLLRESGELEIRAA